MITIAVCDDESIAAKALKSKLKDYFKNSKILYRILLFFDGESLLQSKDYFDLIFLDIRMQQKNGIETASELRKRGTDSVLIFVTALKEYVFDAFDVEALNYLLKPVECRKLYAILDRAVIKIAAKEMEYLILQNGMDLKKIKLSKIMYCEAADHTVLLYTKDGIEVFTGKIDDLEKKFTNDFFRCHRSYIINYSYIEQYHSGTIYLINGEMVPVAKRRQQEFLKSLLNFECGEVF